MRIPINLRVLSQDRASKKNLLNGPTKVLRSRDPGLSVSLAFFLPWLESLLQLEYVLGLMCGATAAGGDGRSSSSWIWEDVGKELRCGVARL